MSYKEWDRKNRERIYTLQKQHRVRVRRQLLDFLSGRQCVDCGEQDPIVLEFDHKETLKKFKQISTMLSGHYSWKSVLTEIGKCEIRCANCHRKKTYAQFGFWGKTNRPS